MRITIRMAALAAVAAMLAFGSQADTEREILALERQGLDGWQRGNPDPLLAILAPEITYFHVVADQRLDGLPAVKALFEGYRGRPLFDSYEMSGSKVQASGDSAVLTYILVCRNGAATTRWKGTQVYQRRTEGWRIIHTHWSAIQTAPAQ